MFSQFDPYMEDLGLKERPIDLWRDKIKNCKFDCWECNYCESVVDAHLKKQDREVHPYATRCLDAINKETLMVSRSLIIIFKVLLLIR